MDLELIAPDDHLRSALALDMVPMATHHDANAFYRLRSIAGGTILALVLRDDIPAIQRFPRGQEFVSSCRLVKCAKASAGTRDGSTGAKIGHADLTWAFSAAAVLFLRTSPGGQKALARWERIHGQGKALTVFAHTLARAVYDLRRRETAFNLDTFLNH